MHDCKKDRQLLGSKMFAKQHLKVPICAFGVFENNVHDATRSCDHWASTKLTRGQMQMLSICVQRSKSKQQKYINAHLEIQQIKIRPWKLNGLGWQIRFMNIYNSSWPKNVVQGYFCAQQLCSCCGVAKLDKQRAAKHNKRAVCAGLSGKVLKSKPLLWLLFEYCDNWIGIWFPIKHC